MAKVLVCALADLPPGQMIELRYAGFTLAVCHPPETGPLAMSGVCPHNNGPLAHGALHGHLVVCPWHAWEFDCRSGELSSHPEVKLPVFPVSVEGGQIFVHLPAKELAQTAEPGAAGKARVSGELEGRAGPVRASDGNPPLA